MPWRFSRRFAKGKRLVVVGGGFIGLEIAASARTLRPRDHGDRGFRPPACPRRAAGDRPPPRRGATKPRASRFAWGRWSSASSRTGAARCSAARLSTRRDRSPAISRSSASASTPRPSIAADADLDVEVGIRVDASLRTAIRRSSPAATSPPSGTRSTTGMSASRPGRTPRITPGSSPRSSGAKTRSATRSPGSGRTNTICRCRSPGCRGSARRW